MMRLASCAPRGTADAGETILLGDNTVTVDDDVYAGASTCAALGQEG
jgi:hypothetical protein